MHHAGFSIGFKTKCNDYNKKIKKSNLLSLKKIIIALAGPITNIIIIVLALLYYEQTKQLSIIGIKLDLIIYSNILLILFNLIPIYPLDGGRVIKEILRINHGIEKSYKYMNEISFVSIICLTILASFGILLLKNIAIVIIIFYLWYLVIHLRKIYTNTIEKIWQ